MRKRAYIISFYFLLLYQVVLAQQNNAVLISVNFQQTKVAQFVSELEAKSNYHFFL